MQSLTDPKYLVKSQYKDSSNLDARIMLHQKFSTNPQGWSNWVFDQLLQLPDNANILELGCGSGVLWKETSQRVPAGWTITLSDLSDGMLDSTWRNLVITGRSFKFERIDAQSIPYADGTFDAVIANHMLYHVPDRRRALKEVRRVLKDEGILFASTLGKNHMREMWDLLERTGSVKRYMVTSAFSLENGKEQMQEFFPHVELSHYLDNLRVTDVSAMMAYIRSMASTADFREDMFRSIERELLETMKQNGDIFIEKAAVLFKASK
ncbi:MAG: class I SAM-dependent methyltransferase [Anaerolineales bacterium]|nr:class I SAM-dependent methyltransferase [Anaerolineales bacterium]